MKRVNKGLITGDFIVLLAFSLGGLYFHRTPDEITAVQLVRVLTPFAVAYYAVGFPLGAFRPHISALSFIGSSVAAWLLGMGGGFGIRMVYEGRPPQPAFVIVALVFTGVLFLGWRTVYWLCVGRKALKS